MMKHILIASAVSMAALSMNAMAHDDKETAATTKAAPAAHVDEGKAHSRAAGKGHDHGGSGAKEEQASALGQPGDAAKVTRTVEVDMNDKMRFSPDKVIVKRNETIRFKVTNNGKLKHEMVLGSVKELKEHAEMMRKMPEMEHADANMVTVESGKTGELIWQFTKAGKFDFACMQPGHSEAGMKGTVDVK